MRKEDCVPKRKEKGIQKVKFLGVKKNFEWKNKKRKFFIFLMQHIFFSISKKKNLKKKMVFLK